MATLLEINNQVKTIENISKDVFKYEMEISHLKENSYYYIIGYNKIYTNKGYNYILKNRDGNYYWATPGTKNFIEESKYPPEFEIKTYSYYKFIDDQGYTYLDEYKKPILELEAEFKKVEGYKDYKENTKQVYKNKVVDDYYISRYIYGLKFTTSVIDYDKPTEQKDDKPTDDEINEINKICEYIMNIKYGAFLIYVGKLNEEHENKLKEELKTNKEKLNKFVDKYEQNKNIKCIYKIKLALAKIETLLECVFNEK